MIHYYIPVDVYDKIRVPYFQKLITGRYKVVGRMRRITPLDSIKSCIL